MKWEHNIPKPMGCCKKSSERKVYSDKHIGQEIRKLSSNLTLHLKELEKEEIYCKVGRGKDIIKTRVKINKTYTRNSIERINNLKAELSKTKFTNF